jgi:hypothetical protein
LFAVIFDNSPRNGQRPTFMSEVDPKQGKNWRVWQPEKCEIA